MKKQLEPTVIYRNVNGNTHVLNYTTGEIMSFDVEEKDIVGLIASRCDSIDISDDVKRLFLKKKKES